MTEQPFAPDWFSRPSDTILALMARRGVSVANLTERTGWNKQQATAILAGNVPIDQSIAQKLEAHLGGSASFWIRRQAQFTNGLVLASEKLDRKEARSWLRQLPVKEMKQEGWIPSRTDMTGTLQALLAFFDVTSPEEWRNRYTVFANDFRYRTSPTYDSTIGALSAWLRRGEVLAAEYQTMDWDRTRLRSALGDLRALTRLKNPSSFIPKLRETCAQFGVSVVFVRAPSGCRASGVSRFVSENRAVTILSFRYLSDDHFWFSFFHEMAHLLLHGAGKTFVDGEIAAQTQEEDEANAFAAGILVPPDRVEEMLDLRANTEDIVRYARSVGVSPGIVVGQMQHHRVLGPQQMNALKRRYSWAQIADAAA